jgi:hypothetical protein
MREGEVWEVVKVRESGSEKVKGSGSEKGKAS